MRFLISAKQTLMQVCQEFFLVSNTMINDVGLHTGCFQMQLSWKRTEFRHFYVAAFVLFDKHWRKKPIATKHVRSIKRYQQMHRADHRSLRVCQDLNPVCLTQSNLNLLCAVHNKKYVIQYKRVWQKSKAMAVSTGIQRSRTLPTSRV